MSTIHIFCELSKLKNEPKYLQAEEYVNRIKRRFMIGYGLSVIAVVLFVTIH